MSKKILYNFPCRFRKDKLFAAIENILSMSRHDNFLIQLTLDIDDNVLNTPKVKHDIDSYGNKVKAYYGFSTSKINAVNKNVSLCPDADIICTHSDDMWFIKEGFDLDILEAFEGYSGLVHFPDQIAKEKLITYAMMSKDYYDLDGFVYNPAFLSVYADNWQQDVAKQRGKYKFVDKQILEHRHFIWGYGVMDELSKLTENPVTYAEDKATYEALKKANNFYL